MSNHKAARAGKIGAKCPTVAPILVADKIVFHDPIPRGEYNLVVSTRCGDGRDYALRRIGHPVTVP